MHIYPLPTPKTSRAGVDLVTDPRLRTPVTSSEAAARRENRSDPHALGRIRRLGRQHFVSFLHVIAALETPTSPRAEIQGGIGIAGVVMHEFRNRSGGF